MVETRHHPGCGCASSTLSSSGVASRRPTNSPPSDSATSKYGFRSPMVCTHFPLVPLNNGSFFRPPECRNDTWLEVDTTLERLQPVCIPASAWRCTSAPAARGRTRIPEAAAASPDHPCTSRAHRRFLISGVGGQLHMRTEVAVLRFRRDLDGLARDVVLPTVVRAAQSRALVAAEPERRAAVGAQNSSISP